MTVVVESVAWAVYGAVVVALFLFSILFTRHFQAKYESEFFATLITILALGLVFSTLALLSVDIFLVSATVDPSTGTKREWATPEVLIEMTNITRIVYYAFYGTITIFCFFLIPFAYFFYEEYDEDQSSNDRIYGALKYTSFFVIISILLLIFGLFLKPTSKPPKIDLDWFKKLLTENYGEKTISFILATLILLGMLVFIGYTAPGLSLLPIDMIKGKKGLEEEGEDVENRLIASRERQRAIKVKYGNKSVPVKEQRELDRLEDEERILSRRLTSIQQYKSSTIYKVFYIVRPFEIILGVILLCTTLVIAVSIFMTIVDKIANAICGSQCGYVINHPKLFNPINFIFVNLSKIFPLDYMFMVCLIVYFFLATMSGIVHVGIRFLWINLYSIKKGATAPQALLVSAVLLTLSLLALNYTMTTTVAPGYAHFGSQVYCNQTILDGVRDCTENKEMIVPCDIYGPTDICTPTVSSTMIDKIIVNTPFFGVFFYYSQWIFLAVFGLGFLVALFKRPRNNSTQDDLQELDEEEENLLSQRNSSYHAT